MILIHMHRISRNLFFLVSHQFGKFQGSSSLSSIMISRISSGASITSPVICLAVNWNAVSQEVLYCYSTLGKRNDHRNLRNLRSPDFSDAFSWAEVVTSSPSCPKHPTWATWIHMGLSAVSAVRHPHRSYISRHPHPAANQHCCGAAWGDLSWADLGYQKTTGTQKTWGICNIM